MNAVLISDGLVRLGIAETKLDQSVQKCWMAMLVTRGIQRGICWSALADYFRTFLSSGQTACHWEPANIFIPSVSLTCPILLNLP